MIYKNKKAQGVFGMSFGVLFSIIIIVAIISVSFYAIWYFLGLSKCANVGLYFEDLQDEVNRAWNSGSYSQEFDGKIPKGITWVCFGDIRGAIPDVHVEKAGEIDYYDPPREHNVFLYPPEKACDGDFVSNKIEHINPPATFFCREVKPDRTIPLEIKFEETSNPPLVEWK